MMFKKKDHLSFLFLKVNSVINKNQPLVLYILVIFYDFLSYSVLLISRMLYTWLTVKQRVEKCER